MRPLLATLLLSLSAHLHADDAAVRFAAAAAAKVRDTPSVRGDDPAWFFPTREVKHLAAGRFWERSWEEVAANKADPIAGIVEFNELLKQRGIRLLVVPVPAKASIYPETLVEGFGPGEVAALAPLLQRAADAGVEVLDLEPVFLASRRTEPEKLLYCRQDAHFSPEGAELVAASIAVAATFAGVLKNGDLATGEVESLTLVGDQIVSSEWEGKVPPETLPVRYVSMGGTVGVSPDEKSPILLLGDSHTLVFHEGKASGMHCRGAGVLDHLAARYEIAPDLVGVRGSGLVQARKQLFYKASAAPGYWDGKRLVVWLFSAREFTQSKDRPVPIPLAR